MARLAPILPKVSLLSVDNYRNNRPLDTIKLLLGLHIKSWKFIDNSRQGRQ